MLKIINSGNVDSSVFGGFDMKNKAAPILAVLCLLTILIPIVTATSNQNLDWGVEVGNRYDYHFRYQDYNNPIYDTEFDFYIEVESLPTIPNDITKVNSPLFFNISIDLDWFFANGTDMGLYVAFLPHMIHPVGNWALWATLLEEWESRSTNYIESITISETLSRWTWTRHSQITDTDLLGEDGTATFQKSDGVLTYFRDTGFDGSGDKYFEYEVTLLNAGLPMEDIIAVGGVVVVLVVVIVVCLKRKGTI